MFEFIVTFAGFNVLIRYDNEEVYDFLTFLFNDVHCAVADDFEKIIIISLRCNDGQYTLSTNDGILINGYLGVKFAAVLFDSVIFNLINKNGNGIALHSGAVSYRGKTIIFPGQSGSGKSIISAWFTAHNFSYLTDELVFFPNNESGQTIPFTRPFCIKSGGVEKIKGLLLDNFHDIIEDEHGAIVPHRSLNIDFSITTLPPELILFPSYQLASPLKIKKISSALVCTLLMGCDVNARNLSDHGFQQVVKIARSTPAYKIIYSCFEGLEDGLRDLFDELNWGVNDSDYISTLFT